MPIVVAYQVSGYEVKRPVEPESETNFPSFAFDPQAEFIDRLFFS